MALWVDTCAHSTEVRFRASLDNVSPAVEALLAMVKGHTGDPHRFELGLLLHEGLANAVRHGCRSNLELWVRAVLQVSGDSATITISDDGDGFDWRRHARHLPDCTQPRGRGLHILQHYSTAMQYNDAGNRLTIRKCLRTHRPEMVTPAPNAATRREEP